MTYQDGYNDGAQGRPQRQKRRRSRQQRSVQVGGHKTSISLENVFWDALKKHAAAKGSKVPDLLSAIDIEKTIPNLSSAVRVYLFLNAKAENHGGS